MSQVIIAGDTSGTITLQAPAVSGSSVLTLPATTATLATLTTPSFASTIGVGGTTASASGAGITFPATQSASSDANTLDDYEEGTWTPTDESGAALSLSVSSATYTKIGRVVFVTVYLFYPSTSSSANANIGGLPFVAANINNSYSYITGRCGYTSGGQVVGQVNFNTNKVAFYTSSASQLTNANLSTQYVIMSGYYFSS